VDARDDARAYDERMRAPKWSAFCVVACVAFAARESNASDINADPSTYKQLLTTLKPGDTLHLAAGHYARLPIANLNGTPTSWITISGPTGNPPTAIIDADLGGCCNTVDITSSSYVALESVTIDGHDVDGAFGISAGGGVGNLVHDIRIEGCSLVNHHGSQQHDAISTKTPTWGWIIRKNTVLRAGTGLYLGNSDGSDPFIGGLIEDNYVDGPIGYCMEIKFQNPRPSVAGMPTAPTSTIIRNNVFIKNDDASPDGDRPNILVGGFPASGAGAQDRYEIYGNFFFHNPRESLLQVSGRVTIHDNVFVDAPATRAMLLRDQDLPLSQAYVYDNTIYGVPSGIVFGNAAPQGDAVVGNLVFAATPISGPITNLHDNMTDTQANAAMYVAMPATTLGQMNFYPLAGKCKGAAIDPATFANDADYAVDFNGAPRGFEYRGAYAGEGTNPGWPLGGGVKMGGAMGGDAGGGGDGGGGGSDAGGVGPDGGAIGDGGSNGATSNGDSGGCGCRLTESARDERGSALAIVLGAIALIGARRSRRAV
jgi:hypothetical protein